MYELSSGNKFRVAVHLRVFALVVPVWVGLSVWSYFAEGVRHAFTQDAYLVVGAVFFFLLDFWTAIIYKIWIRDEEKFGSEGLTSGAKKLGLWMVIGAGATIWANTFPNDPEGVRWYDPRWLGANVDLLGFLYMYAMDTISSIENVTGKNVGDTGIGQFVRAIVAHYFPNVEDDITEMRSEDAEFEP